MKIYGFLMLLAATTPFASGQLYLLGGSAGSPGGTAAALFRVGDDGSVKRTQTVLPRDWTTDFGRGIPDPSVAWIGISYEWRKIVVLSGFPEYAAYIVDFDKASVVKKCACLPAPDVNFWLADAPGRGPSFEWTTDPADEESVKRFEKTVQGMVLDPAVPCAKSVATLAPEDVRDASTQGWGGGLAAFDSPHLTSGMDEAGRVFYVLPRRISLDYTVPAELRKGLDRAEVEIDDSHVLELCLLGENGAYRDLIFRKSDRTWHTLPIATERPTYSRGFGRYIAATEVRTASARNPRSAGKEDWQTGPDELYPGSWNLEMGRNVLPGNLFIYDVDTEKVFPIRTRQGDSEVLLVEGGMVYWRAATRLYSAPITDSGVGQPRLLATDEVIRSTHYAFIKH